MTVLIENKLIIRMGDVLYDKFKLQRNFKGNPITIKQ
jgi:hypothetical protein